MKLQEEVIYPLQSTEFITDKISNNEKEGEKKGKQDKESKN